MAYSTNTKLIIPPVMNYVFGGEKKMALTIVSYVTSPVYEWCIFRKTYADSMIHLNILKAEEEKLVFGQLDSLTPLHAALHAGLKKVHYFRCFFLSFLSYWLISIITLACVFVCLCLGSWTLLEPSLYAGLKKAHTLWNNIAAYLVSTANT